MSDHIELRDFFAAHALTGMLAYPHPGEKRSGIGGAVRRAYYAADLMLKRRDAVKDPALELAMTEADAHVTLEMP